MEKLDDDQALALLKEYSPSTAAPHFEEIEREYRVRSEAAMQQIAFTFLSFGRQEDEFVALAGSLDGTKPIHLFIHGGYWQALSWEDSLAPAPDFERAGFLYGAINYTIAPDNTLAGIIAQCEAAVAAVVKASIAAGGPSQITLSGSSAGGHLCAMMALADWSAHGLEKSPVAAIVALSGLYDLRPIAQTAINDPLGLTVKKAASLSPMFMPAIRNCPAIIAWGEIETHAFKEQSRAYADYLDASGGQAIVHEIAGRNHFDIVFDLAAPDTQLGQLVIPFLLERT